jgi:ketosteroid isomerase-like protein
MMTKEKGALQRMKFDKFEALEVLVDGDRAAIHYNFAMALNDGRKTQRKEIAWQQWGDGKIVSGRYFCDPAQRKPR